MAGKRMSKTLAGEIADRVLRVVNPPNRPLALNETLRRHGFSPATLPQTGLPADRTGLVGYLVATYGIA